MLSAALDDFARVPGVEVVTLLGAEPVRGRAVGETVVAPPHALRQVFHGLAHGADYTLVIAPELDGILHTHCRWVEEAGGRLLGPSPTAVRLTGDKLALG